MRRQSLSFPGIAPHVHASRKCSSAADVGTRPVCCCCWLCLSTSTSASAVCMSCIHIFGGGSAIRANPEAHQIAMRHVTGDEPTNPTLENRQKIPANLATVSPTFLQTGVLPSQYSSVASTRAVGRLVGYLTTGKGEGGLIPRWPPSFLARFWRHFGLRVQNPPRCRHVGSRAEKESMQPGSCPDQDPIRY